MDSKREEKLIDEVRNRQALWEKKHPDFMNATKKNSMWMEIGTTLDEDVKWIKKAWQGLRSQFMAFMKKLDKPTGSDGKRPYFRHENSMGFLKGCEAGDIRTISNLDLHNENEIIEINIDMSQLPQDPDSNTITLDANTTSNLVSRSKELPLARSHSKFGRKRKLDEFGAEILSMMKEEEDEFDSFGKLVATKMRNASKSSRRLFLEYQMKAVELLNEMELTVLEY